jgi:hypothetical protein
MKNFIVGIVGLTLIGMMFATAFCAVLSVFFLFGIGHPNVLPEEGQTYIGWWAMMFGSVTVSVPGSIFVAYCLNKAIDTIGAVARWATDTN